MTLETFLEKLEQTPRDWKLEDNRIRRLGGKTPNGARVEHCPITCMSRSLVWSAEFWNVGQQIGLSRPDVGRIAQAADALDADYDQVLRAKLLKATGLA